MLADLHRRAGWECPGAGCVDNGLGQDAILGSVMAAEVNREGFGVATGVDDQVTPAPRYAAHFGVELDQVAECSGEWSR